MSKLYFVDSSTAKEFWTELIDETENRFCVFYNDENSIYDFSNVTDNPEGKEKIRMLECSSDRDTFLQEVLAYLEDILQDYITDDIAIISEDKQLEEVVSLCESQGKIIRVLHSYDETLSTPFSSPEIVGDLAHVPKKHVWHTKRGIMKIASCLAVLCVSIIILGFSANGEDAPVDKVQLVNEENYINWLIAFPEEKVQIIKENDGPDLSDLSGDDLIKAKIYIRGEEEGLNGLLMVAISRFETGNYTSVAFTYGHNLCGATDSSGVCSYDSFDDGLNSFVRIMKWYQNNGMTSPASMARVYCPPNKTWPDKVTMIMEEERSNPIYKEYCE